MDTTFVAVGVLALGVTALVALGAFFVRRWLQPAFELVVGRYVDEPLRALHERVKAVEADVDELPRRWEEIARDSKKLRDRATYHVRRARSELEALGLEDPELETLAKELRGANGEGEHGAQLPLVQDDLAPVAAEESPIDRALRHKWAKHGL